MADQDRDEPSLELPSLRFGRRRRRRKAAAAAAAAEPATEPQHEPEPAPEPEPEPEPQPEMRSDEDTIATTVLDDPLSGPYREAHPEPADDTRVEPAADEASEQERPLFADEPGPEEEDVDTVVAAQELPAEDEQPEATRERRKRRRRPSLPSIGGMPAAILTGVLVGALTVGLTAAALRGCEAVKGTSSCGGPGLLLLTVILVLGILLGAFLLRAFGVADPGSTSFLAVGLLAVLTLLFLMDALFMWWIVIVVPALAVVTFALAHWVTVAFIEPGES